MSELLASGLTKEEIEEVASVGFQFNFINRVADAVDFPIPNQKQKERQAKVLSLMARFATGGTMPNPTWAKGEDGVIRPAELEIARNELLNYEGSLDRDTRTAIEYLSAKLRGAERAEVDAPPDLKKLVETMTLSAFKIHDGMIEQLLDNGRTHHELFEVVLLGSFGAAVAAQERLFEVLYGDEE